MRIKQTMHGVACDGCEKNYESHEGFAFFHLQQTLEDYLKCDPRGWIQKGEKHYCPNCQHNNQ